jgi:hypothetical protein
VSKALTDFHSYSLFIYTLTERLSFVKQSSLALASVGATLGRLEGRLDCDNGLHVEVFELLDFAERRLVSFSYEVSRDGRVLRWYDSWNHGDGARPHRHEAPRLSGRPEDAAGLSFEAPNLEKVLDEAHRECRG